MLRFLKNKFGQAIEWRVVREVDREREVIKSLEKALVETASSYGQRIAVLEQLVEKLMDEKKNG